MDRDSGQHACEAAVSAALPDAWNRGAPEVDLQTASGSSFGAGSGATPDAGSEGASGGRSGGHPGVRRDAQARLAAATAEADRGEDVDSRPQRDRRSGAPPARRALFPFAFARRHGVMLLDDGCRLYPLLREDASWPGMQELNRVLQRHTAAGSHIAAPERFEVAAFDALLGRLHGQDDRSQEWAEALDDQIDLAHVADSLGEPQDLLDSQDDAPIIRLINALLTEAVREGASDIHVESFESRLAVRLRVDGVLREVLSPPVALAPLIVSRIKVMAKLDIAEKRLPQDGRISLRIAGRAVDVRVSTLPSGHGERVVMRLLDKQAGRLELAEIGMPPAVLDSFHETLARPHGIVLVTGPTGSGKTTTLYAALAHLNDRTRNILTVEDPIEYFLDGIGQTQVNSRIDMSFARGLRAILRQDPDVVMVGEIRDLDTVQIAVQASLTGHLVFSTLHTNSAIGAITRLRDMGVEPFLLASTLNGVLAQRLVRVLCRDCRKPYAADASECRALGLDPDTSPAPTLYRPVGCPTCNGLGYRGRMGIYEWVAFDEPLRTLIHDQAGEQELTASARRHSESLRDDAVRRVLDGSTSLEETLRVTRDDG